MYISEESCRLYFKEKFELHRWGHMASMECEPITGSAVPSLGLPVAVAGQGFRE